MEHATLRAQIYARGDVLSSAGRHGLVWLASNSSVILLPIALQSAPHHRADVAVDVLADMIALGFAGEDVVIHCGEPTRTSPAMQIRTGRAPVALLRRVETAMARNAMAAATEARVVLRHTERCVRL